MTQLKKDAEIKKDTKAYQVAVSFFDIQQNRKYQKGEAYKALNTPKDRIAFLINKGLIKER